MLKIFHWHFLNLSIAFDTIDLCILLQKLQVYGIRGCALKWFCSYSADRSQCVCALPLDKSNVAFPGIYTWSAVIYYI